jgi:hypothetical protein
MYRIFISGTYLDLQEHRKGVRDQLERMRSDHIDMELFGSHDPDATATSLAELERCNIYLGIIGHRYGQIASDGKRSITECEYDRAFERSQRGRMRLLVYLADEHSAPVPDALREEDHLHQKQVDFRKRLRLRHKPQVFKSPSDLALWVAADINRIGENDELPPVGPRLFGRDDWSKLQEEFDLSADDQLRRIQKVLEFLADTFDKLFLIDRKALDLHPFFSSVKDQLRQIIPGISLDEEGGILKRTGVRHVIFRTETALELLKNIEQQSLFHIGEQIGKGAASDLVTNTIKGKEFIPTSAEAYVTLWDYWDRTGGWGRLQLIEQSEDNESSIHQLTRQPEWRIKVENNFIITEDIDQTHRLCDFWCGYIMGLLNEALPELTKAMTALNEQDRARVTLPAYLRVDQVTHEANTQPAETIFRVRFKNEPFSDARKTMTDAKIYLKKGEWEKSMRHARFALLSAQEEIGEPFTNILPRIKLSLDSIDVLDQMLDRRRHPTPQEMIANKWFQAANLFIQAVSSLSESR